MARARDIVPLPSNGKIYPLKEVEIQAMSVKTEKLLYTSSDSAFKNIMKDCILTEGVNLDELLPMDYIYILHRISILTYGSEVPFNTTCPECNKEFETTIDLSKLDVNEIPDDFEEPVKIVLPKSKTVFSIKHPSESKQKELDKFIKDTSKRTGESESAVSHIADVMRFIDKVDGESVLLVQLYSMLEDEEMDINDFNYLRKEIIKFGKTFIGLDNTVEVKCPECGKTFKKEVPFMYNFFRAQV